MSGPPYLISFSFSSLSLPLSSFSFFFNDTATTEIYTFPYTTLFRSSASAARPCYEPRAFPGRAGPRARARSGEHTSELQSLTNLVCRLLLEKKKKKKDSYSEEIQNTYHYRREAKEHVQAQETNAARA